MTPALLSSLRQILGPMTSERKCEEVVRVVLEGCGGMSGFLATLTPEQRAAALAYCGDDHHGEAALSPTGEGE